MSTPPSRERILAAGAEAQRWITVRRFIGYAKATALPLGAVGSVVVLISRFVSRASGQLPWILVGVALWLIVCGIVAWLRRPTPMQALARWDAAAGRPDVFASAYAFASSESTQNTQATTVGQQLHLDRSSAALRETGDHGIERDLPLPGFAAIIIPIVALFLLGTSPVLVRPLDPGELALDADALTTADEQAEKLEAERDRLAALEADASLSQEEREKLQAMREALEAAAEELADADGKTAEEVLDALESRAREAEKMADQLGETGAPWASDALLEEMSQHADFADLAAAVQDQDAASSKEQSTQSADRLQDPALAKDVAQRMDAALQKTIAAATESDLEKFFGKGVNEASTALTKEDTPTAAKAFSDLAEKFAEIAQREKTQEELQKIADALREAGSAIAGQDGEALEKLAANKNNGSDGSAKDLQSGDLAEAGNPGQLSDLPLLPPGMMDGQLPPPSGAPGSGQAPPPGTQPPIPGTMNPGEGNPMGIVPGGKPGESMMLLAAPIPGTKPGAAGAAIPIPGQGNSPGQGGLLPGQGSYQAQGETAAARIETPRQGTVVAQQNASGQSSVRAIEGGTREEDATRTRQQVATEFLKVEEAALDEKPIPLSRKTAVRRYFNSLREKFETSE